MKRKYLRVGDWKRNVLIMATASCLGLTACDNSNQTEQGATADWSGGQTNTKGVITELTEVSPDKWQITDERPAGAGEVAAIVRHYDGQVDTLKGEALQQQMQQYASVHPTNTNGFGMMDVLMWSSIGYMAGRMMSPNPRYYANPNVMNRTSAWRNDISQQRSRGATYGTGTSTSRRTAAPAGRSGVFSGRSGGFYS
ncbi:hypothetical protein AAE02nite_49310 [Adhaeribacter aerolatus]|uniref:UPF0323 domain-containing protein n=1 Tax=Adhaeribacter aerolatus TaxID=670289 RepID=A0A512B658_9BACT|nr:hypothetical protein [Adhaeribacter aerolatus]GEO07267.1 hypothetical protein AAE02nite_49310 [Adhaeribacter aerolatus]